MEPRRHHALRGARASVAPGLARGNLRTSSSRTLRFLRRGDRPCGHRGYATPPHRAEGVSGETVNEATVHRVDFLTDGVFAIAATLSRPRDRRPGHPRPSFASRALA